MQDLTGKIPGSQLTAAQWNELPQEVQNIITNSGKVLSSGDLTQTVKALAISIGSSTFYSDGGAANAYVLTNIDSLEPPETYTNGMSIRFIPTNANTAASDVNVAGLGNKTLVNGWGDPLIGGELQPGRVAEADFILGSDHLRLRNSATSLIISTGDQAIPTGGSAFVNVTGFSFPVVANARYLVNIFFGISATAAIGINWIFDGPAASYFSVASFNTDTTVGTLSQVTTSGSGSGASGWDQTQIDANHRAAFSSAHIVTTNAGTMQLQIFETSTPAETITIHEETLMEITRIR